MSLERAYRALYGLVGALPEDHFVFTSSGAEAINHLILATYLDITRKTGKNHFVTSSLGEAPEILAMSRLQEMGCALTMAEASPQGVITLESITEAITPRTALISLSHANGLTGVMNTSLPEISSLCQERGILLHVDASHTLGKGSFSWEECGAHLLTFHGEDLGAPAGTGGLFLRGALEISPLILGGEEQGGLRGGSFSQELLIELGIRADLRLEDHFSTEIAYMRCFFEEGLVQNLSDVKVLFQEETRVSHISCCIFQGVHMEALRTLLEKRGVLASGGGGRFQRLPLLLKACKIDSHSALSFRFHEKTTRAEVEEMISLVADSVTKLRKYSQHLDLDVI